MCKACKMDSREVARYRERQGAVDVSDFDEEPRYRHPPRRTKRSKSVPKVPGCPGNDGKAHVYIYTTEKNEEDSFFKFYGYHRFEYLVCCGCGKTKYGKRPTTRYGHWKDRAYKKRFGGPEDVVRGKPVQRYRYRYASYNYFAPERDDVEFMNFHRDRMARLGLNSWYYSW